MPTVPQYDSQAQSRVGGLPQHQAAPSNFGQGIGDSLSRMSGALEHHADMLQQHALRMQDEDNHAQADEAISNYLMQQNELLYNPDHGYYNSQGKNALDQFVPARQALIDLQSNMAEELSSPKVKHLFDSATRSQVTYNLGNMGSHAAAGRRQWVGETSKAVIEQATNSAVLNYTDDKATDDAMTLVRDAVLRGAQAEGLDDPVIVNQRIAEQAGKVWSGRIQQMSLNDPVTAQALYDEHRDMLQPDTQIALGRQLASAVLPQEMRGIVEELKFGVSAPIAPFANAQDARDQISHLIPGAVFTSGRRTPEHNAEVGGVANSLHLEGRAWDIVPPQGQAMAQLEATLKNSNLGFSKVLNEGDHVHVQWGARAPGAPAGRSVDIAAHGDEFIKAARDRALELRPGNLMFADGVENLARAEVNQLAQAQRAQEIESVDRLATMVAGGVSGEEHKVSNPALLYNDPGFRALPASSQRTLVNMTKANANEVTPERQQNFNQLHGMALTSPSTFVQQDLLKQDLTPGQLRSLSNLQVRAAAKAVPDANVQYMLSLPEISSALTQAHVKKPGDANFKADDKNFNGFVGRMRDYTDTFIAVNNKQPSARDLIEMSSRALVRGGGNSYGFQHPTPQVVPGVPDHDAAGIADYLRETLNREPTVAEIQSTFKAP